MLFQNGLLYFELLLLCIFLTAAIGAAYFLYNLKRSRYDISDEGIKKINFMTRVFIPWESVTGVKTNIKSPYASINLYYNRDGIVDSMGVKSCEDSFNKLKSALSMKKVSNMDKLSYYAINEKNFERALYILLSEEYKLRENDSRDDLYDEETFRSAVKYIIEPDAIKIREINYIINNSIKNPQSILLVDDFTGIISSSLWTLGYEVTSLQHTHTAVDYASARAKYDRAKPTILNVRDDEIQHIIEHDVALLVYPSHGLYNEYKIQSLLRGLLLNLKSGGGLLINNEILKHENLSMYFAEDIGKYLNEPVIGKKYSRRTIGDMNFANAYIEVGLHSLNTYRKFSTRRVWKDGYLVDICEGCGFRFIKKIEDSSYLLFEKQ